ncbi:unnamed protein product [Mucor hiemalis]
MQLISFLCSFLYFYLTKHIEGRSSKLNQLSNESLDNSNTLNPSVGEEKGSSGDFMPKDDIDALVDGLCTFNSDEIDAFIDRVSKILKPTGTGIDEKRRLILLSEQRLRKRLAELESKLKQLERKLEEAQRRLDEIDQERLRLRVDCEDFFISMLTPFLA